MTPLRQLQELQAELASLKSLLQSTPADPLATPLLRGHVEDIEDRIRKLETNPPLTPATELFFREGAAFGTEGLEVTFASGVLESYQNMVSDHYSAKNYGKLRRFGRRRREAETQLFLTALPRASFGLQLSQKQVEDFVAATNLSDAMLQISLLVEATVESDATFERALAEYDARVFRPLKRFIETLHSSAGDCRIVTGFHETKLSPNQIADAYDRVSTADLEEETTILPGVFGGLLTNSWQFDFCPDGGDWIRGSLSDELSDSTVADWNLHYTSKLTLAELKISTVVTRTGKKKPGYVLLNLKPLNEPPKGLGTTPPPDQPTPPVPPAKRPKRKIAVE